MTDKREKRGPKPETVKIDEDWEDAVKKALEKKRPKSGWPGTSEDKGSETDPEPTSDK